MNIENITISDLIKLSEQDKYYSLAINPLTIFVISFALGSTLIDPIMGLSLGITCLFFSGFIHHILNWSSFGKNWKLMFRCTVSNKNYFVVKDGARRLLVFVQDSELDAAKNIKNGNCNFDETFIQWLENSPENMQLKI